LRSEMGQNMCPSLLEPFTEDLAAGSDGLSPEAFESCGPALEILSIRKLLAVRHIELSLAFLLLSE
jgi:hypothetical protein